MMKQLFRQRETIRPDLAAALERLDQLAATTPALREAAALQRAILGVLAGERPQTSAPDLPAERAAAKLQGGLPLLRHERVALDTAAIQRLMLQLCRAISGPGEAAGAADQIAAAIERHSLNIADMVQGVLGGQVAGIHEQAAERGLDGGVLGTLLRFSLFPSLEQLAAQLAPLRADSAWRQGYCPTCGSWPLLGEYRGLEQARVLRCGLCATEWPIDRLVCPFCGSRDHKDLGYLHVEGDEHIRAATCERCLGYVKTLATLGPIPAIELAVHDLATIHLDLIAVERGYAAPQ
jgi:FdhE protein